LQSISDYVGTISIVLTKISMRKIAKNNRMTATNVISVI